MIQTWSWPDSTVVRVVDGDSLVAVVHRDLGFHGTATFQVKLRLNRINAPPMKTPEGAAARSVLTSLTQVVSLHIDTVAPYKYGDEWMAEITLGSGDNVSDLLVLAGMAVYWDGQGPRPGG